MSTKPNYLRGLVCPLVAAFIWGSAFVAQDVAAADLGPFTVNAVRSWIGAFALLLVSFLFRKQTPIAPEQRADYRRQLLWGGLCCGILLTVAANLQQAGIGATDPGKAGFITSLYVVLVPIFGIFVHRRAPYTVWIGVVFSLIGLYFLCITESLTIAFSDLLILLCAIFFALQILLVDRLPNLVGMHLCCAQLFVVAITSTVLMFVFEEPSAALILKHGFPLVYIGVFSSAIAYTLQIVSQKGSNPTVVSLLLCLESVFAVLTGLVILHDTLSTREIIGCCLMFVAVVLANIPPKAKVTQ
ncbi:MAG: DMT family transporter [Clostridia bacterium]|nr:DMT family transporter [Clostridia bacterium]